MADPNTRTGKRTPVTLKIKFKSETIEQFIERYAVDVSQGGIFIRTKEPLAVGTQMKFEFQLRDASPLIAGEGTVVWTRENDPSRPAIAPGMGVRFDKLAEGSPVVLERILHEKTKQQPARAPAETTKPPLFTDTPTRVAPAPVQDMLHGGGKSVPRTRTDSSTPLPGPMPFHSDADEFPEEAFEEATKVRSLDELVAQTAQVDSGDPARDLFGSGPGAGATSIIPPDELAMRRQQARLDQTVDEAAVSSPLIEPPEPAAGKSLVDRDSAPGLPSPPSVDHGARAPRMLDTSPSPRSEALSTDMPPSKTRIGLEPAKVDTRPGHTPASAVTSPAAAMVSKPATSTPVAPPRSAVAKSSASSSMGSMRPLSEPSRPTARPSILPIVVIVIAAVAAAAAALWFLVLKDTVGDDDISAAKPTLPTPTPTPGPTPTPTTNPTTVPPMPTPGSNAAATPGSDGSAGSGSGSAIAAVGSNAPAIPAVKTVDTVIASSVDKATVTLDDPAISGPAPFTAKLEAGKTYKAHVSAPGYATLDLDIKGGQAGQSAKLVAKPKLLTVTSDPPGAQIMIEGSGVGHVTPFDVDIKAYAGKAKLRVTLRKVGYKQVDETVDVSAASDVGGKMMVTAPNATLVVAPIVARPVTPPVSHPPAGSDGDGSASEPTPGSAATPTPDKPEQTPDKPATPPPGGGGSAANGEPEPDFAK